MRKPILGLLGITIATIGLLVSMVAAEEAQKTRPDSDRPTQVSTSVLILNLREIDGAHQTFTADVGVRLRWKDPRLASPEKVRMFPPDSLWNPDIQLVNRVSVQTTLPETLVVDSEGNVVYRQRYIGQFSCRMDLREFPLDRQSLPIRIAATSSSPQEVQFVQDPQSGLAKEMLITDWNILSWRGGVENLELSSGARPFASYRFELMVQRQFNFFLIQIILPMALILGMSWIVFWLDPAESSPRISISITAMLTIVAYRLLISNFLPRLSFLTRMDLFVFGCTFLVFLTLICVVVIHRLIATQKKIIGINLDKHSRWVFPGLFGVLVAFCFLT